MKQWIVHVDMDAFFAAIEQRDYPELVGKPVIIGGLSSRGVVATASYEARCYGVRSAMPIVEAKRRCPHGFFLPSNHKKYEVVSNQFMKILAEFSPAIEPLSLDEAFLDVSGMDWLYRSVHAMGYSLKQKVKQEVGLTASVGIAPNKLVAKIASDLKKPDGLVVVAHNEVQLFLENIAINRLWGVGKVTADILKSLNIDTVGKLAKANRSLLKKHLGEKAAYELCALASGEDKRKVIHNHEPKSIGNEITFLEDLTKRDEVLCELLALTEKVGWRLRHIKMKSRTITLKVRFSSFRTITRSCTLTEATNFDDVIYHAAKNLFMKVPMFEGVRLVGVSVSNLQYKADQIPLFDYDERLEAISQAVDKIKDKFGEHSIQRGRV